MDEGLNPVPVYAEGLAAARQKDGKQIAAEIEISREHLLFRVEPGGRLTVEGDKPV